MKYSSWSMILKSNNLGTEMFGEEDIELVKDSAKDSAVFSVLPESEEKKTSGCTDGRWLSGWVDVFLFVLGFRPTMRRGAGAVVLSLGDDNFTLALEMEGIGAALPMFSGWCSI